MEKVKISTFLFKCVIIQFEKDWPESLISLMIFENYFVEYMSAVQIITAQEDMFGHQQLVA